MLNADTVTKSDMFDLESLGACSDAVKWYATQPSEHDAWHGCRRGDWLLWIAARRGVDHKKIVLAACGCARLSLKFVIAGEDRPLKAIKTAEAWTCGEASIEQVKTAAYAATAAAAYAATAAAAHAAAAAVTAAAAAYAAAATAADAAAYAAAAAAYAAAHVAAARKDAQLRCAHIVRSIISFDDLREGRKSIPPESQQEIK